MCIRKSKKGENNKYKNGERKETTRQGQESLLWVGS